VTVTLLRGDARRLPLPDQSVDLICTSPPYWGLRSYRDGGQHYGGQIGAEPTPAGYLESLWDCTAEWLRVLKSSGSIFVVLGDAYSKRADGSAGRTWRQDRAAALQGSRNTTAWAPRKSLLMLPDRYRIGCADQLGAVVRQVITWAKPNGMPESVADRCRRSHEDVVHLTAEPLYYSAVDLIREPHTMRPQRRPSGRPVDATPRQGQPRQAWSTAQRDEPGVDGHPLGRLPGDVWTIAPQPLLVPDRISHARCCDGRKRPGCEDGLDHHAAYPPELVRRIITGWCPPAVCEKCGQGRFPVALPTGDRGRQPGGGGSFAKLAQGGTTGAGLGAVAARYRNLATAASRSRELAGWACDCTPYTDHPGTGQAARRRADNPYLTGDHPQGTYGRHQAGEYVHVGPWREYHLAGWEAPPARPAVVLDPFGGTGTTALVADLLGMHGISVDMSADYCDLARWRTTDPGEIARAAGQPKPRTAGDDGDSLFGRDEAAR
jgi:DNA modification methylase